MLTLVPLCCDVISRPSQTPNQRANVIRKTPGATQSRMKRRASLFAAGLKKIVNDVESENSGENHTSIVKDIVMETTSETGITNERREKDKFFPEETKLQDENGLQKEDSYSQRENKNAITLKSDSEFNRNIINSSEKPSKMDEDVHVPKNKNTETAKNSLMSSCGVPTTSFSPTKTTEKGSTPDFVSLSELSDNEEAKGIKIQEQKNSKKRKAELEAGEDIEIPELKKIRTEKVEEASGSRWEETMNEV
jgi:hypothetical protein